MNSKNRHIVMSLFLISLSALFVALSYTNKESKIEEILEHELSLNNVQYRTISKYYKVLSNNINKFVINDKKVIDIFKYAKDASDEQRVKIRQDLQDLLQTEYEYLKTLGFGHIHFYLPDNTSFLRMYKPSKYGDDLTEISYSVKKANKSLKPVYGFEEGQFVNGFRYVFPLFDENANHIGSVESSIAAYSYIKMFQNYFFSDIHFLIKKSVINKKLLDDEIKKHYANAAESQDYYSTVINQTAKDKAHITAIENSAEFRKEVKTNMEKKHAFALYAGNDTVVSFLPIQSIKDKEIVAYFSVYSKNKNVQSIQSVYWNVNTLIVVMFSVLMYFISKENRYRKYIEIANLNIEKSNINLEKQKAAFETLFEKSSDGILIIEDGRFVQCNERIVEMLKFNSKDELLNVHPSKLSPKYQPDGEHSFDKANEMMIIAQERDGYNFEWVHRRADGEDFWTEVVLTPISLVDREIIHVVWRDISRRKELEATLQEYTSELEMRFNELTIASVESKRQEMYLKKSQEIAHIGVWEFNITEDILYWSDEVYNIFGVNKEQFTPSYSSFLECIHPDDRDNVDEEFAESVEQNREYKAIHRIIHSDGSIRYVEERATPIFDEEGEFIKAIGITLDITERKELELRLLELNQNLDEKVKEEVQKNKLKDEQLFAQSRLAQMGEMISMIAHQWRQPLSAISSTAANLEMKIHLETYDLNTIEGQTKHNDYFLKQLGKVELYVENLTTTIDDFRNFYKPNKESIITTFENVATKALNVINGSLVNDNIEIVFDYRSDKELKMHDNEMMQVILNFLKNAQDNFIEKEIKARKITIATFENSISICDNGGGIPDTIIKRIFDPYFSTKDEKNGTGLGLYMSKIIVEDHHNGELFVQNIDAGVCFTINIKI